MIRGEVIPASGTEIMVRAETQSMISMARVYPRDEAAFERKASERLERMTPERAGSQYYSIPYKENKGTAEERTVYVEGPSVHAATQLARLWGNQRNFVREIENSEARVVVEGVFMDAETNGVFASQLIVSKTLTLRNGSVIRLSEDRLAKAVAAAMEKARRNAILKGMPQDFVEEYWTRAREIATTKAPVQTPDARVQQWVEWFSKRGVAQQVIETFFGKPMLAMTDDEYSKLRGIANAIKDGFAEPMEAFAMSAERAGADGPTPTEPVQQGLGDVIKGKAE